MTSHVLINSYIQLNDQYFLTCRISFQKDFNLFYQTFNYAYKYLSENI